MQYETMLNQCHFGDVREQLAVLASAGVRVQTCITSPPYFGLRSYLPDTHPDKHLEIGLEQTPEEFIGHLVEVFRAVRDLLEDDGTLWLNIGDSYAGSWGAQGYGPSPSSLMSRHQVANHPKRSQNTGTIRAAGVKPKDLYGIPWMLAFALRADGWHLRQDIIWAKPNPMPESVADRCTKSHEYLFLLSKGPRYYFDQEAIAEPAIGGLSERAAGFDRGTNPVAAHVLPGQSAAQHRPRTMVGANGPDRASKGVPNGAGGDTRNKRSVWTVATRPYAGAHFATFPPELIEPCVLAGAPPGGIVLDPFFGSGTTGQVAQQLGRQWIGIDINRANEPLQRERLRQPGLVLEHAA